MSKSAPVPPRSPRPFIADLDAARLAQLLEDRDSPPYSMELYRQMRARFLAGLGDPYVKFVDLFDHLDDFAVVEEVFRQAGFVVGFNVARQLMLGELDLDALTKDEDESEDETPEGGAQ